MIARVRLKFTIQVNDTPSRYKEKWCLPTHDRQTKNLYFSYRERILHSKVVRLTDHMHASWTGNNTIFGNMNPHSNDTQHQTMHSTNILVKSAIWPTTVQKKHSHSSWRWSTYINDTCTESWYQGAQRSDGTQFYTQQKHCEKLNKYK